MFQSFCFGFAFPSLWKWSFMVTYGHLELSTGRLPYWSSHSSQQISVRAYIRPLMRHNQENVDCGHDSCMEARFIGGDPATSNTVENFILPHLLICKHHEGLRCPHPESFYGHALCQSQCTLKPKLEHLLALERVSRFLINDQHNFFPRVFVSHINTHAYHSYLSQLDHFYPIHLLKPNVLWKSFLFLSFHSLPAAVS